MRKSSRSPAAPRTDAEWIQLIEEWRGSQQGTREFCELRGISVKTFQWRRWSLERRGRKQRELHGRSSAAERAPGKRNAIVQASAVEAPAFIELVDRLGTCRPPGRRYSGVEILVAGVVGDHRVRVETGFDTRTLREVVATLRGV